MHEAQMTQHAMAQWGRLAQSVIAEDLAIFAACPLGTGERLTAIAGLIAAATHQRHEPGPARFLERLRNLTRPSAFVAPPRSCGPAMPRSEAIEPAFRSLVAAFDRMAERLAAAGAPPETARAVEAVLLARLLAAYRPHLVRLVLIAAAEALARPDYRTGDLTSLITLDTAEEAVFEEPPPELALTG
jgi:hypothetical protein